MLLSIGIQYVFIILISVAYTTLADRKFMAGGQRREGPNVVGPSGLLQPLTDGGKLYGKQIIYIKNSNLTLFKLSPILIFSSALFLWIMFPFFSHINLGNLIEIKQIIYLNQYSIIGILLIMSFSTAAFLSAGWSSFSNYSKMGGVRGGNQVLGYELNLSFIIIILVVISNSISLSTIMLFQSNSTQIFLHFDLFIIFWISVLAECGRVPFDLPESESELVAGYFTEYSGFLFALFFLAEYSNMIFNSIFAGILFFNGWIVMPFSSNFYLSVNYFKIFISVFIFLILFALHRSVLARVRIDQIYYLNWKIFMIILGSIFFQLLFILTLLNLFPHLLLIQNYNLITLVV